MPVYGWKCRIAGTALCCVTIVGGGVTASAGNQGSDLGISLTPATGGMAGVGVARPQDPVARQFGNPATLTQIDGETAFTLGGSFLDVDAEADHEGPPGNSFSAQSDAENYLLPEVAVQQRISDDLVAGGGIHPIAGLGADFRDDSQLSPVVEFVTFGANAGVAYDVTERWTVGASATLGFGFLELGLSRNTALSHAFGVRGDVGTTYDAGPVILAANYRSPMEMTFDEVTETSPGTFSDFTLENPQQVSAGIATSDSLWPNAHLEANFRWKNWSNAEGFQDVWDDQYIASLGGQYQIGNWTLRSGYSYSSDLQKDNVGSSIGNISSLAVGGQTQPLNPTLVKFVQATLVQPYWQQQVTVGAGYALTDTIRLDAQVGYAFDGDRQIANTEVEVNEFQAGAGLTWTF